MTKLNAVQEELLSNVPSEKVKKKLAKLFKRENKKKEFKDSKKLLTKLFKKKINPDIKLKKNKAIFSPQIPEILPKKQHDQNRLNDLIEYASLLKATKTEVPNEFLIEIDNLKKILR